MLGLSDSSCMSCCQSEPILHSVWQDFQDGRFVFATKKKSKITIPIARVDISKKYSVLEDEKLIGQNSPSIFVYYEGKYFMYDNDMDKPLMLLHFINRLLHPVVTLRFKEDIELFLNVNNEHMEHTKFFLPTGTVLSSDLHLGDIYSSKKFKTRVIACVYNKGDYEEELNEIRSAARKSANRFNLRIAIVTDPRLVKSLKKETSWFGDASLNTIILKRYDDTMFNLDLLQVSISGNSNAFFWMWKKSIKEVEELNSDMFEQINMLASGVVLGFVDFNSKNKTVVEESYQLVNQVLPKVAT